MAASKPKSVHIFPTVTNSVKIRNVYEQRYTVELQEKHAKKWASVVLYYTCII